MRPDHVRRLGSTVVRKHCARHLDAGDVDIARSARAEERTLERECGCVVGDRVRERLGERERTAVERREQIGREVVVKDAIPAAENGLRAAEGAPCETDAGLEIVEVVLAQRPFGKTRRRGRDDGNRLGEKWVHVAIDDALVGNDQPPVLGIDVEDDVILVAGGLIVVPAKAVAECERGADFVVVLNEAR